MRGTGDTSSVDVPVLIVGGGAVGLSMSVFLSNLGIEHLLVERHPTTSILPKAHYLNQRTMEIFRQHGVADALYDVAARVEEFGKVRWCTSLGGDGPFDRQTIFEMDAFGGGSLTERYAADSPCLPCNHPQLRLEPLLRGEAERRAPGQVRFHHELVDWTEADGGVVATVVDRDSDEELSVRARYLVAADGGKTIGPRVGADLEGPVNLARIVSTHFSADLSSYWDDGLLITWFVDPEGQNAAGRHALAAMGPTWGRHSEEWVVHFALRPDDPARFDEATVVPRIRALLKLPDLGLRVHQVSHWVLDRVVADRWRFGPVFLAGDAAHRQPPTSGLGLNTGVQDAHNLAWKLAQVLAGRAGDGLLDTYETERKPVSAFGADWAMLAAGNHALTDAGIGLAVGAPAEFNRAAFAAFVSDTELGCTLRARAALAISTQKVEFQAHDVELGFSYAPGALVPDGSDRPPRDPMGSVYTPTTRPGHRLPHAWVERDGCRISTHDLVGGSDGLVLIAGPGAAGWCTAAREAAEKLDVDITCTRIGLGGDWTDPDGTWSAVRGFDDEGAILVRPDHHVAWRSAAGGTCSGPAMADAVTAILARSGETSTSETPCAS